MKRLSCVLFGLMVLVWTAGPHLRSQDQGSKDDPKAPAKLLRGAKPTPFPKIIAAIRSGSATVHRPLAAPAQVIVVPKKLSMWGNSQYGDCVSAESAFSMAAYSTYVGIDEIFIPEANVIDWARAHGFLNGADLLEVIQAMQADGIKDEKGVLRKAGTPSAVKYSDEPTLQSAIAQGPVSIAIDANALPSGAGNNSGWYAFYHRQYPNTDHCVSLSGYGPTSALFAALGVPVPAGAPANGYLLFTWNTIGVVDHQWLLGTVVEAWVRNPTVTDLQPPPSPPGKITVVMADVVASPGTQVKFSPTASGGTSPYVFLFSYGDGTQDASGSHSYQNSGSYKVTVTAVDSTGQTGTTTCTATVSTAPPSPPPNASGTVTWTINGVTSQYELFPLGTRSKFNELQKLIGPMAP